MRNVTLAHDEDFDSWRDAARSLVLAGVPASEVVWQVGEVPTDLFGDEAKLDALPGAAFLVSRQFIDLAHSVVSHSDRERFGLLYTALLRLRAQPHLLDDRTDPLVQRLELMAKAVRRDMHKMRAFLRFRELNEPDGGKRFVAWFEPEHHIVRANAGFFVRRFANMRWSILTPELSVHWDGDKLSQSAGATRTDVPDGDPLEETWRTYYASIFNPARVKVKAMLKEMPKKYWANMPETALIPGLIASAQAREMEMVQTDTARRRIGDNSATSLVALAEEAAGCTRCHLYEHATQTVFGEGPPSARLMLVGEQPGDQEDLAGHPFVGPAGQLLDRALKQAGVPRQETYVTNAVKHFKFEPRGKRRLHKTPEIPEINACRWWIEQERALLRPPVVVALGATAARSLLGRAITISRTRGAAVPLEDGSECWVTVHPSYLLRLPDREAAALEYEKFVADLRQAHARVAMLADG